MTVHECPHCECAECAFCGKRLENAPHTVAWDYYKSPPMYSRKTGHQRDEGVDACNTCATRLNHLLTMLQHGKDGIVESAVVDVADHPMLREDEA